MISTVKITGKILLLSGLHIGGTDGGVKIGGIDLSVIKNPISGLPYIPGSSLKGKTRYLLEHYFNVVPPDGSVSKPGRDGSNKVAVIYGHIDKDASTMPTRVIYRDSHIIGAVDSLDNLSAEALHKGMMDIATAKQKMNSLFSEGKTEVTIDRNTGTVNKNQGGPRQIERVPAGTVFDLEIILRIFIDTERDEHLDVVTKGLRLLQNDALGGYGSRGSGRIKFFDLTVDGKDLDIDKISL